MDRVIKFRGKNENGDWIFGGVTTDKYVIIEEYTTRFVSVKRNTVGQFSGLFDSDGNEIYEGDIISFEAFGNPVALVHFEGSAFGIGGKNGLPKRPGKAFTPLAALLKHYDIYVIGNIHDNPELLEGGNIDE